MGLETRHSKFWPGLVLVLTGAASAQAAASNQGKTVNPHCQEFMAGTACNAIDAGLTDQRTSLAWRRVPGSHAFVDATSLCERTFGPGWRLPTLYELEDAYRQELFGYCDMTILTSTEGAEPHLVWHMGARYEGEPRCEMTETGEQRCVGGCGAYWFTREPVAKTEPHTVVCVRD